MPDTNPHLRRTNYLPWEPLSEDGVVTDGIFIKLLRHDETTDRSPTIMLKFEPGASYPNHVHPGGEELFVLEGEITVGDLLLKAGDYLYAPPGSSHRVSSLSGGVLLAVIPEEVSIVDEWARRGRVECTQTAFPRKRESTP